MPKRRYLSNTGKSDKDYEDWATDLANVWGVSPSHILTSKEYDYPTYFAENREDAAAHLTGGGHFPDTYKTAEHPTFSDESRYSGSKNKFNPKGITGGRWTEIANPLGQQWNYQFSPSQIANGWNIDNTLNYLSNAEDNGVYITMPNGNAVLLNGDIYGGVLPAVNVLGKRTKRNGLKEGGGIHINPDNRGKFTETMRRTGKSAEELSHSSNPLTRKRAIFALNARKWHHG